jgi:hypothetical protein
MKKSFVYLLKIKQDNKYKIGMTCNFDRRISALKGSNPYELELIYLFYVQSARSLTKVA